MAKSTSGVLKTAVQFSELTGLKAAVGSHSRACELVTVEKRASKSERAWELAQKSMGTWELAQKSMNHVLTLKEDGFHKKVEDAVMRLNSKEEIKKSADENYVVDTVTATKGPMKKLNRLLEKMVKKGMDCSNIMDVVRGLVVCSSNSAICKLLDTLEKDKSFVIYKVKEGYSRHEHGQWVDVKVILALKSDPNQHKCELQIAHKKMVVARKEMGGHEAYSKFRSLGEAIAAVEDDNEGADSLEEMEKKIRKFVSTHSSSDVARLARIFSEVVSGNFESTAKLETEIGELESQLPELVKKREFTQCARIQKEIDRKRKEAESDPISAALGTFEVNPSSLDGDSFLDAYPLVSLEEYRDTGEFWHINSKFPGLRAVSKDPWVFIVPNLLSQKQCEALMAKGATHMVQSKVYSVKQKKMVVDESRSSWDVRVPFEETPGVQRRFSELLNMPGMCS